MMFSLEETQQRFADALIERDRFGDALTLFSGDPALRRERFGIYRSNVRGCWTKALGATYPVIARLVGEEFFAGLAIEYVRAFGSRSGDLNELGDEFAEFLETFPPAHELPYLPDVARLEWRIHRAHYAADPRPFYFDVATVRTEDLGAMKVRLHPACALVASAFPIAQIWRVHQTEGNEDLAVDFEIGGEFALVYRPQYKVCVDAVSRSAAAFIDSCVKEETLDQALKQALQSDAKFDFSFWLARFVSDGVIAAFND